MATEKRTRYGRRALISGGTRPRNANDASGDTNISRLPARPHAVRSFATTASQISSSTSVRPPGLQPTRPIHAEVLPANCPGFKSLLVMKYQPVISSSARTCSCTVDVRSWDETMGCSWCPVLHRAWLNHLAMEGVAPCHDCQPKTPQCRDGHQRQQRQLEAAGCTRESCQWTYSSETPRHCPAH